MQRCDTFRRSQAEDCGIYILALTVAKKNSAIYFYPKKKNRNSSRLFQVDGVALSQSQDLRRIGDPIPLIFIDHIKTVRQLVKSQISNQVFSVFPFPTKWIPNRQIMDLDHFRNLVGAVLFSALFLWSLSVVLSTS